MPSRHNGGAGGACWTRHRAGALADGNRGLAASQSPGPAPIGSKPSRRRGGNEWRQLLADSWRHLNRLLLIGLIAVAGWWWLGTLARDRELGDARSTIGKDDLALDRGTTLPASRPTPWSTRPTRRWPGGGGVDGAIHRRRTNHSGGVSQDRQLPNPARPSSARRTDSQLASSSTPLAGLERRPPRRREPARVRLRQLPDQGQRAGAADNRLPLAEHRRLRLPTEPGRQGSLAHHHRPPPDLPRHTPDRHLRPDAPRRLQRLRPGTRRPTLPEADRSDP